MPLHRPWPRASAQQACQMPHVTLCVGARSLLEYDTQTKEVKVLLDHLRFPNGVQLSPAEDFVLVAELAMVRISRCVSWPGWGKGRGRAGVRGGAGPR